MARKRGKPFKKAIDAQDQLEDIEKAQQASRKRKGKALIDCTEKSSKRLENALKRIRTPQEGWEEFS